MSHSNEAASVSSRRKRPNLPHPGMRILKSAVAIILCYFVSFLRGDAGIVFYSQLAALWCIQMYTANTFSNAAQRMIGTVVGALYGLVFLLLRGQAVGFVGALLGSDAASKEAGLAAASASGGDLVAEVSASGTTVMTQTGSMFAFGLQVLNAAVISGTVFLILYTTVLLKKKQASYFSCVVFLSIVVNHASDANPYLFVWNRFLDTVIGILIGLVVNTVTLPRAKRKDILFVSGVDDTLIGRENTLSDYSRVELNRMLDDGANFTLSTMRTPASLLEPMRDVRLRLPVIVMDGAALYDIRENRYLKKYTLSADETRELLDFVQTRGLMCFTNVIWQDTLVIYYQETGEALHASLVAKLRRSPLRNYLCRRPPEDAEAIYLMLLYPRSVASDFYAKMEKAGLVERFKVLFYDSTDYPGYAYIKIYNKEANRSHMLVELKQMLGLEKTVTFGSIPGQYDVVIHGDMNRVVRVLRGRYEPVIWRKDQA